MSGLIKDKRLPIRPRQPPLGPEPDYSLAFYPDPPSHDFCVWLIIAELVRRYHRAPGPLRVKFGLINGQLGKIDFGPHSVRSGQSYECGVSREYHNQMMANVLRPAIEMIGAIEEPSVEAPFPVRDLLHHPEYDYHQGHLVDAGRAGFEIPKWNIPKWAFDEVDQYLRGVAPVVLTLRETNVQPERNSRINDWLMFAALIERHYPVLILRDTCKAEEPLPPFQTWPRASFNVYVRAALYQRALLNMMVGNGPNVWAIFSAAPFIFFKQLVPELPNWAHGRPDGWREQDHMEVGDQFPWALPTQRLAWADDTFENLCAHFDMFLDYRKAA